MPTPLCQEYPLDGSEQLKIPLPDVVAPSWRRKVLVLGSGAYRIGSSVEFDWCGVNAIRTVADHDEDARNSLAHSREDAHDVEHALHRTEVRDVHEHLPVADIAAEPPEMLEAYGATPGSGSFANNCLLARRLAEETGQPAEATFDAGIDLWRWISTA